MLLLLSAGFNKNLKKGQIIRLENILFYRGRSVVLEESQPLLDRVAEILVAREDIHFEIHGHVCCINPVYDDAYNRDTKKSNLSYARAKSIFETLRKRGVSYRRMKYKGYGRTKPLGGLDKLDRRVELYITKIDKD
jgi:outer membrane protein OmpA-like peptidoglycan-associated protein